MNDLKLNFYFNQNISVFHNDSCFLLPKFNWFVIQSCSLWEKLGMVDVWRWMGFLTIWILNRFNINKVKWDFSVLALPKFDYSLAFSMYGLIFSHYCILSCLPFETPLSCYNIIWHNLFSSKFFNSKF